MPEKLKQAYNNSGDNRINAVTNKDDWSVDLSITDYLWWETQHAGDLLIFKDIDVIKNEMLIALSKILDSISLDGNDKDLQKIIFEKWNKVVEK